MSPFIGIILLLVILAVAWVTMSGNSSPEEDEMAAAPAVDGRPVSKCTTQFYTRPGPNGQTEYCVKDGARQPKCESLPLPAIIAANEMSDSNRCDKVTWGFGCEKGMLCGLQQSGPNLVSSATAGKIAREQCGRPRARLWC